MEFVHMLNQFRNISVSFFCSTSGSTGTVLFFDLTDPTCVNAAEASSQPASPEVLLDRGSTSHQTSRTCFVSEPHPRNTLTCCSMIFHERNLFRLCDQSVTGYPGIPRGRDGTVGTCLSLVVIGRVPLWSSLPNSPDTHGVRLRRSAYTGWSSDVTVVPRVGGPCRPIHLHHGSISREVEVFCMFWQTFVPEEACLGHLYMAETTSML